MNSKLSVKQIILITLLSWNALGFLTSVNIQWDRVRVPGTMWDMEYVHSNCVYKSIGAFTNLGYVTACELYRTRWEIGK